MQPPGCVCSYVGDAPCLASRLPNSVESQMNGQILYKVQKPLYRQIFFAA